MPYIPSKIILEFAKKHNFAFGAFNINTPLQVKALIEACEELRTACIIQVAEPGLAFLGGNTNFLNGTIQEKKLGAKRIAKYVKKLAEKTFIPVSLHLDHGRSFESIKVAINAGFNSVMIDGSDLPYNQNVSLTKKVADYAHKKKVSVEGELGVLCGTEDNISHTGESLYTEPKKALDFVKKTNVDLLAISYGTMHGPFKGTNIKLKKEIVFETMKYLNEEKLNTVLVSHGSSLVPKYILDDLSELGFPAKGNGIPINELLEVIPNGISKINIDSDIRIATKRNLLEFFKENPQKQKASNIYKEIINAPEQIDYRVYLKEYINELINGKIVSNELKEIAPLLESAIKEIVLRSSVLFGSVGNAKKILD